MKHTNEYPMVTTTALKRRWIHCTFRSVQPEDIELITAHCLQRDRSWVIAHPETILSSIQERSIAELVRQRSAGVPLAYLTGHREFYGRDFIVGKGVLIPRPESEHLVEAALELIPQDRHMTVTDVGTGSGCLAVTLALERPKATVYATDINSRALGYATANVHAHELAARVTLLSGDLLWPLRRNHVTPDLIIANLPYATPNEYARVPHEPRRAIVGGTDGLTIFRRLFSQLLRFQLTVPVILETDPRREAAIKKMARSVYPTAAITTITDLAGWPRVIRILPG